MGNMENTKKIVVGNVSIGGGGPVVLIAGPCVIESEAGAMKHAKEIKAIADDAAVPFIFKASYDKANRTSIKSFRGPGLVKGLAILKKIKARFSIPILSDVHSVAEMRAASKVLDIIQIPAFLSRQTDLLVAAAKTGRVVNIKKGQFLAPWDMEHAIGKVESAGNFRMLLTERGVSFGYNNLVSDFRSLIIMKEFGYPVIYDATHSVQMPGGKGSSSGGEGRFVPTLSLAAAACGIDGLFLEVHLDPERSLSDGANMIRVSELGALIAKVKLVNEAAGGKIRPY